MNKTEYGFPQTFSTVSASRGSWSKEKFSSPTEYTRWRLRGWRNKRALALGNRGHASWRLLVKLQCHCTVSSGASGTQRRCYQCSFSDFFAGYAGRLRAFDMSCNAVRTLSREGDSQRDKLAIFPRNRSVLSGHDLVKTKPCCEFRRRKFAHLLEKPKVPYVVIVLAHFLPPRGEYGTKPRLSVLPANVYGTRPAARNRVTMIRAVLPYDAAACLNIDELELDILAGRNRNVQKPARVIRIEHRSNGCAKRRSPIP